MEDKNIMSSWDWIRIARAYFLELANHPYTTQASSDVFRTAAIELRYAEEEDNLIRAVDIVSDTYFKYR